MNQQQKWNIESLWEKYFLMTGRDRSLQTCLNVGNAGEHSFDFSNFQKLFPHTLFPNLHFVEKLSPQHAAKPVFFDDGEEFFGLKEYQLMISEVNVGNGRDRSSQKKPIYLFDNHDLALIAFAQLKEFCSKKFDVVHIDAHRDDAKYPYAITEKLKLEDIPDVLKKTRVSDYLDVATRGNIIGDIVSVTQSSEFDNFEIPKESYILNLDLDIFGPEGTAVDTEKKIEVIAKAWKNAAAVVLATSPGCFNQKAAFWLAELFTLERV